MRPGTLRGYLAAISVVHQTAQLDNPTRSEAVRRTLAGIGRHPAVAPPRRREGVLRAARVGVSCSALTAATVRRCVHS